MTFLIMFCDVLYWWITWDGLILRPRISSTSRSIHTFGINSDLEDARLKNPFEINTVYSFSILSNNEMKARASSEVIETLCIFVVHV